MRRLLTVLLVTVALAACKKAEAPKPAGTAAGPAAGAPAPGAATGLRGKILERADAPPYTYLRLATGSGEVWAAVPATQEKVGAEVSVGNAFPMKDFESKQLNKKFDVVYFGTIAGAPGEAPAMPPGMGGGMGGGMPGAMGGAQGGAPAEGPPSPAAMAAQHQAAAQGPNDVKIQKIAKASGAEGRTVEEVWAQKAGLKEKPVTVKGQVVKFSPGIMGRNWVHLRDGSGSADKNNNDITVTHQDAVAVGDVVTARDMVRVDKDFGAGYSYPVIIEDAKVAK
jgi:hypothetical protein